MSKNKEIAVLLVNLGTPDSPKVPDVRKYLREFLLDKRVIDINPIGRWMLVNLIIAPFRAPKSAKTYQQLWEDRGSPLLFHGQDVQKKLQPLLPSHIKVYLAMRYQSPSVPSVLEEIKATNPAEILIIPMFPQYASATNGSVHDKVMEVVKKWEVIPEIKFISQFFEHPLFVEAFAAKGKAYLEKEKYDHVVFSYHGLPERQIKKSAFNNYCQLNDKCCSTYHKANRFCYRAQCFETSRKIAAALGLSQEDYTVCFQSRLGNDPWIRPYAEEIIKKLAKEGKKKVLTYSPAFVADCLETTIEVGEEFKEEFLHKGGEKWQLVDSLNSSELWIKCLEQLVLENV